MSSMSNKQTPRRADEPVGSGMLNIRLNEEESAIVRRHVEAVAKKANLPLTVGGWAKHLILQAAKAGA